jgi:hypothetical protein
LVLKEINQLSNNGRVFTVYVLKNIGIQERWLARDIIGLNRTSKFM